MTIEIKDNENILFLEETKSNLYSISKNLNEKSGVDIIHHLMKIMVLVDNAIKKERISILNSEIDKLKRGESV